jgi:serine/threonine protein kinase/Tfp pilus assembly protein PilF
MELSIPQIALMSRLLDEALPLDAAGRRLWLERLSPEYQDLASALRSALLPEDSQAAASQALETLPKLGSAEAAEGLAANGLQPGARVGPYELIRPLGAGGMAQVWLARRADGAFKREVALKLPTLMHLRADLEQRFVRERDILASLEHPHIARFYDAGIDPGGLPYLAMEYVHGEPLTEWCDTHRLGTAARLRLFLQVLEAVQYAHAKHVIHRDLKPSNVLVTEAGEVQLLDFGIAKLLEAEEADQTPLTRVYGRALTPDYASPELLRGDPVDARSDIYSLGVVLYELLTGVRPYRLKNAASMGLLEQAVATVDVKKPSTQIEPEAVATRATTQEQLARQLRGDLDAVVLKALAKQPTERYQSAAALAEDLQRYREGKPIHALPARFTDRSRKFVRRNKAMIGVSVTAVAAILATLGYTLHRETVTQVMIAPNSVAVSAPTRAGAPTTANLEVPVAAFPPPAHSVAVLPFVDMSEKKDQEYFSDGLSEELIDMLTKIPELRVPARTSSFYFKGKQATIVDIAKALAVAHVLEGSVRKSGNTLRITAQLVRVDNGYHVWSETYDRKLDDIFKIQDEIAGAVVTALRVHLLPRQRPAAQDEIRPENVEAYNLYLQGKQSYNQGDLAGYQRAVTAFRAATALDSRYAAAYADLALAQFWLTDDSTSGGVAADVAGFESALAAAEKAVAFAPGLAAGYAARGFVRAIYRFDFAGGQADLDKAVALSPRDADVLHRSAVLLAILGKLPAAIAREEEAVALDPLSAEICMRLGFFLVADQQLAQARPWYERALAIAPNSVRARFHLGELDLLENHPEEALAAFRKTENEDFNLAGRARAEYSLGHAEASQRILKQLIATGDAYQTARVYAWRGEKDQALRWLERAYLQRDVGITWIKIDPLFRGVRGDPRYKALLQKMNLPE